jgi:RimJ/RimL family protein N-acetyltransferase
MLENYPKEIRLRTGEKVTLRPMVKDDEQRLLQFFLRLPEDDRLFLKHDVTDPKVIKSWVRHLDYKHVIPILAEMDGRIIGDATLHFRSREQKPTIGEMRVVTDRDLRRRGLGRMMAREIYFLALSMQLDRLVAEVVEDQPRVIKTFESLGFHREEVLKGKVTDLHGQRHNVVILIEDVRALWKKIEDSIERDVAHYSRG